MNYLKYTQYVYLVFALFFIYDAISKMIAGEATPWLTFIIAGVAIFMFFFRRKFAKKFDDHNSKS
jgi:positive regulator of sigma E activity